MSDDGKVDGGMEVEAVADPAPTSTVLETVDVTGDGGIIKEILKYGTGEDGPETGDEVEGVCVGADTRLAWVSVVKEGLKRCSRLVQSMSQPPLLSSCRGVPHSAPPLPPAPLIVRPWATSTRTLKGCADPRVQFTTWGRCWTGASSTRRATAATRSSSPSARWVWPL